MPSNARGGNRSTCYGSKVMEGVEEDTYLGDLISSDGRNKKNVEKIISEGLGIILKS